MNSLQSSRMADVMWMVPYLGLGAVVGFLAGLLGIGGGTVLVPALTMIFMAQGFLEVQWVHMALGTSMASIVLTSMSSAYSHHQHGAVRWDVWKKMAGGLLFGTFFASFLTMYISHIFLATLFSAFLVLVSIQMFFNFKPKSGRALPNGYVLAGVGTFIGSVSALVAIGGGVLSVPFLTRCNIKIQHAIGTSAALGMPIAFAGALGYMITGWGAQGLPAYSAGYVYMPAVILISLVSMFTAPLGAKLVHRLPIAMLKKLFAILLLILAVKMLQLVF